MNGFAADGNMFVKKVKQRLEVRSSMRRMTRAQILIGSELDCSGTDMRTQKTCRFGLSHALSKRCCTRSVSSLTMSTTSWVASRRMVSRLGDDIWCVASSSTNPLPGSGAVYSFDPVGSYEREACRAAGAAQSLVQPFLDNQVRVSCAPTLVTA